MIGFLLATIGAFLTVFFEHIFLSLFSFSLLLLVSINIWNRIGVGVFLFFTLLTGFALDVTLHIPLGFNIFILGVVLLIYFLLNIIIPFDKQWPRYVTLFLLFLFGYFLYFFFFSLFQDGIFAVLQWGDVLTFVFNSFISLLVCILVDRVILFFRGGKDFDKIRLK